MKGRGTRVLTPDDLQKVTPSAQAKTHYVIVDAVGVTKSLKTASRPLDTKPSIPFKDLAMSLMMGDRSEETVSSLAARLARLDNKLGAEDQAKIAQAAGQPLTAIVRDLFDAIDPDKVEADAKAAGHPDPDDSAMQAAREERIKRAANVFTGLLINLMDTIRRDNEQTIDHDNLDTLQGAEWAGDVAKNATTIAREFDDFLKLTESGFDGFVEATCKPYYAPRMGAPSLPPGRYFRMHMIGYFEGIGSERGIAWRCSDSLSLRAFLRLANRDKVPDHSWLSKTRGRLPHEVHEKVFDWVLALVAARGLVKGERIGVDGSTMEANAALRAIVRRDSGETYREMLTQMAKESGVETPTIDDLVRLDRRRKGKKLSNKDWTSPTDPDAKIARMKDGTTHLAYQPGDEVAL